MKSKASDLKANTKVNLRKLIKELNQPDPRKFILKVNYYQDPPENQPVFLSTLLREASKKLPCFIDPLWAYDKIDDWKETSAREFIADYLNYFYLEIEEARYEANYFGLPTQLIRTDMRQMPGVMRKLLNKVRGDS